ncbi:MAG: three-Cys-motif partner protein TcmP [Gammaproteobacteria bacterium]|nr:three-Cys-motif partner protein TcmP [Gammaproteobacteria bacterium]
MEHRFGGIWTQRKLDLLRKYLAFYTRALAGRGFTLHYADAFAGTGTQNLRVDPAQGDFLPEEDFHGSVRVALEIDPPFDAYHFNETDSQRIQALENLRQDHPGCDIRVTQLDANAFVPGFCESLGRNDRAVMLLDPYSTELDWNTPGIIGASRKVDLWFLFPISALLRMTPRHGSRIREEWSSAISRLLGNDGWKEALYRPVEQAPMGDLFGDAADAELERLNVRELELWVTTRLREIFSYVADPVTLYNLNRPLFLFYFAVANPSEKAWQLAARVVGDITRAQAKVRNR